MTGLRSQGGHVGFRRQTVKGTYLSPAGGNGKFMRTRSGALGGSRELLIPDPEIGGNRDLPDANLGPVAFKGTYEFYARMNSLDGLLTAAFGSVSTGAPVSGAYTHTITPVDQGSLPWVSIEEQIADVFEVFRYTDAKVNTLHLEADANGYLMGSAGMVALRQTAVGSASATPSPTFDVSPMTVGSNITLTWDQGGGGQFVLPAKSFSFDLNNNLEEDDFRLGSLFLGDAVEKRREFQFGVTLRPDDSVLWRTATYGDPTGVVPGGLTTKKALRLKCQTYEAVPGGGTLLYTVQFDLPKAVIEPFEVNPSGDDILQHDLTIRALRPDPNVAILTAQVINENSAPF